MATDLEGFSACPSLPPVEKPLRAAAMRSLGAERGERFYRQALECAHSLALQGLPAQAILLINRAFSADLSGDESVLSKYPLPYAAMRWVMESRRPSDFIGNPRRHFQHLATRMVEPRRALRSARAWACWFYAKTLFPDLPADEKQIAEEGVTEPSQAEIGAMLERHGLPGERRIWEEAIPTGPLFYSSFSSAEESSEL